MPNIYVTKTVYDGLTALKNACDNTSVQSFGEILGGLVGQTFDFTATKETGLIGAISETIAWQYLWDRGIIAFELGYGRPSFKPLHTLNYLEGHLTEEQLRFLGDDREHLSWDFVGHRGTQACLVEVKTSRPGKRVDGLRSEGRRRMTPRELRAASRLGFTLLLVTVELTENWEAIVTDREIPVA